MSATCGTVQYSAVQLQDERKVHGWLFVAAVTSWLGTPTPRTLSLSNRRPGRHDETTQGGRLKKIDLRQHRSYSHSQVQLQLQLQLQAHRPTGIADGSL
jgi:hypothetical protein